MKKTIFIVLAFFAIWMSMVASAWASTCEIDCEYIDRPYEEFFLECPNTEMEICRALAQENKDLICKEKEGGKAEKYTSCY